MDWFEQLFGVSPDGGSGATEALYTAAAAALVVAIVARRRLVAWTRKSRGRSQH
ncbi:hypothetical protein GCM10007036_19580 [Alsobacter metallidurans]|uniref:Uncharacterized protein n=1 Tax=Alsobacter metallidurans TaxID=340221 RepID=A0A917I5W9_9HYPH|nr:hypothetical protein [Alsobacter metallidurans]GGH17832.1 hypothetical protein GCM10007036_19580 [Alsobacter metallidurans]